MIFDGKGKMKDRIIPPGEIPVFFLLNIVIIKNASYTDKKLLAFSSGALVITLIVI